MVAKAGQLYDNVGASKDAIQYHYDVGNRLYEGFLGPTMAYSAGIWREPARTDNLDDAQNRKLDWHIDQSQADIARRVLDVGCGWGSIIKRLSVRNPKAEVTGLTMSDQQAAFLRSTEHGGRADIKITQWQSFESNRPFDAIISVEAIEHFAKIELTHEQRVQAYRDFFDFCRRNLVADGRMTLQMAIWNNIERGTEPQFRIDDIFPESCLPHVPDLVEAADGLFHVVRLEVAPRDFIYTLRDWIRRLEGNREALSGQTSAELVQHYINSCRTYLLGFTSEAISLARMTLQRRGPNRVWAR